MPIAAQMRQVRLRCGPAQRDLPFGGRTARVLGLGPGRPAMPRAPQSLFKILARVGQRRLGMGCEALLAWQGAQMPRVCLLC